MPADTFRRMLDNAGTASTLEATIEQALDACVFGVPAFVVGSEHFWDNDRLALLRHYLIAGSCSRAQ